MQIRIEVEGANQDQLKRYTEIFSVLLAKGGLDGVRSGSTIIHFDHEGQFQGIQLDYWPWRRRKQN